MEIKFWKSGICLISLIAIKCVDRERRSDGLLGARDKMKAVLLFGSLYKAKIMEGVTHEHENLNCEPHGAILGIASNFLS